GAARKDPRTAPRGAEENLVRRADGCNLAGGNRGAATAVEDVASFDIGQDLESPARELRWPDSRLPGSGVGGGVYPATAAVGEIAQRVVMVVEGNAELLQVVGATDAARGLADLLNGRHQQPDQDGNDGYHHQKLNQGKARSLRLPQGLPRPGHSISSNNDQERKKMIRLLRGRAASR